jgi:penicillin-binding protein 1A
MWYALAKSMNRPTVDLYFRTGTDTLKQVMKALGLPTKDVDKPAMALGATEVSLRELVPAYGAFAMGGKRVTPQLITRITDATGKELYKARAPKSVQAIGEHTAADLIAMLRRAVDQGTGTALRSRFGLMGPYTRPGDRHLGGRLRARRAFQQRAGHRWLTGTAHCRAHAETDRGFGHLATEVRP